MENLAEVLSEPVVCRHFCRVEIAGQYRLLSDQHRLLCDKRGPNRSSLES